MMDHEWTDIPEVEMVNLTNHESSTKKCLVCGSVLFIYQDREREVRMALKILSDSSDNFSARRVISCGDEVVQHVLEK